MTNYERIPEARSVGEYETREEAFEAFAASLQEVERYYKEDDPANIRMGVFAEAARTALEFPHFADLVQDLFETRPDIDFEYARNLLLRGYQADLLEHDPEYPIDYDRVEAWHQAFEDVEHDELRWAILRNNICSQKIQSNIPERYKSIKLLSRVYKDRFGDNPSMLDVGSSLMHGDIKLAFGHIDSNPYLQFGPVEFALPGTDTAAFARTALLTRLANKTLQEKTAYGYLMGVDITNVDDPVIRNWAMSCSFYPDELMDEQRKQEFTILDRLDKEHERIEFFRGDFSDFDARQFRRVSPVEEYDIINFSTIKYQLTAREWTAMIVNAANFLSPEGIIVVQDAPDGNFSKKFNYLTEVIDGSDIGAGPQPIFRWENGRCKRAVLELGTIGLNGARRTFPEALLHHSASVTT